MIQREIQNKKKERYAKSAACCCFGVLGTGQRRLGEESEETSGGGADEAELAVLVYALVAGYAEHRASGCRACDPEPCPGLGAWQAHKAGCRVCQGDAPLTFGWSCRVRDRLLADHRGCARCLPCPHPQRAIAEVLDWREARLLRSRAEALRAEHEGWA